MSLLLQKTLLTAFTVYRRLISPFLPPRCRFFPTCSAYAQETVEKYGVRQGLALTLSRLCRCHPWGSHGIDLVPCSLEDEKQASCDEKCQTLEERTTL